MYNDTGIIILPVCVLGYFQMEKQIMIPSYGKIFHLGSYMTDNIFTGHVQITEKLDGSMFRWSWDKDGNLEVGSKGAKIDPLMPPKMFQEGVDYLLSIKQHHPPHTLFNHDLVFYGEYLQKPHHNVLTYTRTPKNHIALFDVFDSVGNKFIDNYDSLVVIADLLGIDVVGLLMEGDNINVDNIRALMATESYLGNTKVEGVVIKNYGQSIEFGNKIQPLFCKFVSEAFKEHAKSGWTGARHKQTIDEFLGGFCTEARWQKAVGHLRDDGKLKGAVQDIGPLVAEIQRDLAEEEALNIKAWLYRYYINEIQRISLNGFVDWYKNKLVDDTFKKESDTKDG